LLELLLQFLVCWEIWEVSFLENAFNFVQVVDNLADLMGVSASVVPLYSCLGESRLFNTDRSGLCFFLHNNSNLN
jgi:hypothetical protein